MARIKTGRSIKVEALCDFGEAEASQKVKGKFPTLWLLICILGTNIKRSYSQFILYQETELSDPMTAHCVSEVMTQCETAPVPDKGKEMVTEVKGHNDGAPSKMVTMRLL